MSDYISKNETIDTIWNAFNSYGNSAVLFEVEETKAIRKFCSRLQREIELLPTVDEKEIIRKTVERIVERLEEERHPEICGGWETMRIDKAIEICKEEGWIE